MLVMLRRYNNNRHILRYVAFNFVTECSQRENDNLFLLPHQKNTKQIKKMFKKLKPKVKP